MATHFHPLTVRQVKRETPDCVSVTFDVPETLNEQFLFEEGQNITIKKNIGGEELRRSYSICAAPHEGILKVAIKGVEGGLFSLFANKDLKQGDVLEVLPPTGRFTTRKIQATAPQVLAIAAGSGITPVISIIKHILAKDNQSNVTLVYGNRSRQSIIFFEELESLKNKYVDRFSLINILSRERTESPLNYGRIDEAKLRELQPILDYKQFDAIYICGPENLVFTSRDYFTQLSISEEKIHFELFTTPGSAGKTTKITTAEQGMETGNVSSVTVKLDGRSFDFQLAYAGQSILDAALGQGADLPYACKGGVCCTCRAKLVSGKVDMDVNYALEPEEIAEGFILTCQSHPRTENIIVDFDVK